MGRQSSRLIYQGKDHKDIYFQGKYHKAMYLGNQLLWKKLQKIIPYVSYDGDNKVMCIKLLFADEKAVVKVVNLTGEGFSDFNLVRGDNAVGYFLKDTSWVFSKNGWSFLQTPKMSASYINGFLGYAMSSNTFMGVGALIGGGVSDYSVLSRSISSFEDFGNSPIDQFGALISGYIKPTTGIFVEKTSYAAYQYYLVTNSTHSRLHAFDYSNETKFLGAKDVGGYPSIYVLTYRYAFDSRPGIEEYTLSNNGTRKYLASAQKDFYFNIMSTFYHDRKFIVYSSENGKLQIYETKNDFMSFTEVETPQSIVVKDMDSDGKYTISFDSTVSGDVYLQPYCTLDNTFYFDEDGVMHDNDGCLFTQNINEKGFKKIVTIYFDNFYFRQSENNFCQILIYEEEDIEPPLFE